MTLSHLSLLHLLFLCVSSLTCVTEEVARTALLTTARSALCWGRGPAENMVITSITSSSILQVCFIVHCEVFAIVLVCFGVP